MDGTRINNLRTHQSEGSLLAVCCGGRSTAHGRSASSIPIPMPYPQDTVSYHSSHHRLFLPLAPIPYQGRLYSSTRASYINFDEVPSASHFFSFTQYAGGMLAAAGSTVDSATAFLSNTWRFERQAPSDLKQNLEYRLGNGRLSSEQ